MNSKEYFKKEDKSGTLSKEKFVKKDNISAYNDIINYTSKNNLHELRFKEIVYLYINDITEIPKCKNTKCLKKPKFINKTLGYLSFCSNKCQGTSTEIKEKRKNTNIEIYGTEHPIFNDSINEKFLNKIQNRTQEEKNIINEKRRKTNLSLMGYDNPNKNPEIIEKRIKSFKNNIDVWKEKYKKTTYTYYKNFYNKYENETFKILETYKSEINNQTIIHAECNLCKNNFNINYPIFFHRYKNNYIVCINCNPLNNNISSFHLDVLNFIKNIYSDEIIINDRNELNGREIDIFLPKMDIGIECNGLYWHSEQFIHKTYHRDKYLDSKKNDIRLFQIWEDDWNYKKDILKSKISEILNLSEHIISDNTTINLVCEKEAQIFLNDNYLYGFVKSDFYIGLYHNKELVSIMTFNTIENKKMKQYFELSSFCNKLNMNIINSHLKLFTYFLENYSPEKIVTNNILEWSECEIYSNLGMVCDNKIHINKFYMINNKKVKYLKKHKLANKRVIIIWCCGIEKYIWEIENNHNR